MTSELYKTTEQRMKKALEALGHELQGLRTGRAHTSLLDSIKVPYYGTQTPLQQVANIVVEDARTLSVTPWEKKLIPEIEKAIRQSELGLNPVTAGQVIRVPLPALTEERRRDLVKLVKEQVEHTRVSIRNIRRDANQILKERLKSKEISEDESRAAEIKVQQLTDKYIKEADEVMAHKEADIMKV